MAIRILLVDDHEVVRAGIRALLNSEPDLEVIGESGNGRDALTKVRELRPDVIIMDITMPGLNGVDAAEQIAAEGDGAKVLCLSIHTETHMIRSMFMAGARGYLVKSCATKELVTAVRAVAQGRTYLSPVIAGDVVRDFVGGGTPRPTSVFSELSSREREVLQLLADGKSVKQVADQLFLSANTVHTHRQNLMNKLGLETTADIVKYAIRQGLTTA